MTPRRLGSGILSAARHLAVLPLLAFVAALEKWESVPFSCRHCGHAVRPSASGSDSAAWCDHCKQVCMPPLLKVPGWVASVMVLLLIKLQAGL